MKLGENGILSIIRFFLDYKFNLGYPLTAFNFCLSDWFINYLTVAASELFIDTIEF